MSAYLSNSSTRALHTFSVEALESFETQSYNYLAARVIIALIFCWYLVSILDLTLFGPKLPFVGSSRLLPRLFANYNFFKDSGKVLTDGYSKFKNDAFWFARNDADMIVLPLRQVEEIRSLSKDVANPTSAHAHNLLGRYTKMNIILKSDLHFRMIQQRLTPNLNSLADPVRDEIEYALKHVMPECKGAIDSWTVIRPYHLILDLVSRASARAFVGLPICRDKTWLEISTQFTENVFTMLVIMRLFPTFLHPVISRLIPARWKVLSYIKRSQDFLVPEIERRKSQLRNGSFPSNEDSGNLLSWMIEEANDDEQDSLHLAHLEVVVSLASIHTSQMNAVHVLYDLAANPSYFEPLRQEISDVLALQGGTWTKASYGKLRKLDSFLRESQRFNPPSRLSYHRIMQQSVTLDDGTRLPKGAHICMAVNNIQNDPDAIEDPETFDPFRWERMRNQYGHGHLHQFATTEPDKLNFGYGKYACPGRFFASLEIKSILVLLLSRYDFKLCNEKEGRPENLQAYEFIFPNPEGKLLMKERRPEDQIM